MILWAVTAELLFSTTAKRRKMRSSKWTRKKNCSFHMGFRVFRWMGFVRKWQLSSGMPRMSTSMHGLPVLLLGHTFWPETTWGRKQGPGHWRWKRNKGNLCTSPLASTKNTLEWTRSRVNKSAKKYPPKAGCDCNQATTRLDSWEKLVLSPAFTCHYSTVKMFKYLQSQAIKMKLSFARRQRETGRLYGM